MRLLNAFSLNMLGHFPANVMIRELSQEEARVLAEGGLNSAVGHEPTAAVFAEVLGSPVTFNRATVTLLKGEVALVGQYRGPRLEEGVTTLPLGASIVWYQVTVD